MKDTDGSRLKLFSEFSNTKFIKPKLEKSTLYQETIREKFLLQMAAQTLLPSCITQVTVPNENDLSIEEGINDQLDPNEYDRKHSNEKWFKSNACNANELKIHSRSHTSEKLHKCDLCHEGFGQNNNSRKHEIICKNIQLKDCIA
ncbi:hypothetical protein DINM_007109 [Dirofilaria immitis]|nr:hypothetical protein [Dirofilaria immitis]